MSFGTNVSKERHLGENSLPAPTLCEAWKKRDLGVIIDNSQQFLTRHTGAERKKTPTYDGRHQEG